MPRHRWLVLFGFTVAAAGFIGCERGTSAGGETGPGVDADGTRALDDRVEATVEFGSEVAGDAVIARAMLSCRIHPTHCGSTGCLGPLDDAERFARDGGPDALIEAMAVSDGDVRAVGAFLVNGVITRMAADGTLDEHLGDEARATLEGQLARAQPCNAALLMPLFMAGGPLGPARE